MKSNLGVLWFGRMFEQRTFILGSQAFLEMRSLCIKMHEKDVGQTSVLEVNRVRILEYISTDNYITEKRIERTLKFLNLVNRIDI